MQTTLEIKDSLLRQAKEQAQAQGRSFDSLVEEALQAVLLPAAGSAAEEEFEGLEEDDPFFTALDEIRSQGLLAAPHREVSFS